MNEQEKTSRLADTLVGLLVFCVVCFFVLLAYRCGAL